MPWLPEALKPLEMPYLSYQIAMATEAGGLETKFSPSCQQSSRFKFAYSSC